MLSVIIVAAGSGRRMGFDKLLAPLGGSNVLSQTVQRFLATECVDELIIVAPAERFAQIQLDPAFADKAAQLINVEGGSERHFSVKAGLDRVSPKATHVGIHDGARPLVTPEAITACYQRSRQTGAATLARPATETIKKANADGSAIVSSISRERLWFMETPQIFSAKLIQEAYLMVEQQGEVVTDEVSALQTIDQATALVSSPCYNIKVTYPEDLQYAEHFLHLK